MPDKPPIYEVTFTCVFRPRSEAQPTADRLTASRALRIAKDALYLAVQGKAHPLCSYQAAWHVQEADVTPALDFEPKLTKENDNA